MKFKHILKTTFIFFTIPVKSGPLKGKKWIATSGGKFLSGKYETYKTEAIVKNFLEGEIFYDIGAHIGYFSAIASTMNKGKGQVIAFEPRPMNIKFFKRHMKINNFVGVTLYEVAVGEEEKTVLFDTSFGSATGKVSEEGRLEVKQVSIDKMFERGEIPLPTFIKIDVEGAEMEVLKGMKNVISLARPKIIIATHNDECHKYVIDFINDLRYTIKILNPERVKGDTEIIALPS